MLLRGWKRFPITGDRKCFTHLQKEERSSEGLQADLVPERIIEGALSEAFSAHMKENKVLRNSSMDLLSTSDLSAIYGEMSESGGEKRVVDL